MRRILFMSVLACAWFAAGFSAAAAQPTLGEVVDAVEQDGYYVEPGADVDSRELAELLDEVDGLVVVVLAADDPDGADVAAEQVVDAISGDNTAFVVSPGEVGAVSDVFSEDELDDATASAINTLNDGGSTTEGVRAFAISLGLAEPTAGAASQAGSGSSGGSDDDDGGGGGGGGFLIFLAVVLVVIGGLFWFARRKAKKVDTGEVEAARAEIRAQLEVVAHDIVEHEAAIDVSGNGQAIEFFRKASATYTEVSEEVEVTTNLLDLAELNDDIDLARWELEAAQALMEGRDLPPKPEPEMPAACFFDPTHKPGVEECTIKTDAGNKEVRVCRTCAEKLEKGERPKPRMIEVGGKRVPAAKAPRSHGGLGMGGLSIFEVILGGLGALAATRGRSAPSARPPSRSSGRPASSGVNLDWGEMLPKRRPSGDVFGQDRQPPRPRALPRTSASRPSSSRRRRGGSSSGARRSRSRQRRS